MTETLVRLPEETALHFAVRLEATNFKQVGSLYSEDALRLAALLEAGKEGEIHLTMCEAQDATTDPMVWNRAITALRNVLKRLPDPLVFTETRHFQASHRARSPLFVLAKESDVKATKKTQAEESAAKAAKIEADNAASKAAAEAEADSKVTAMDVVNGMLAEADRLNLNPTMILADLFATMGCPFDVLASLYPAHFEDTAKTRGWSIAPQTLVKREPESKEIDKPVDLPEAA